MPHDRIAKSLAEALSKRGRDGLRKGAEPVITGVVPAASARGPRYLLDGHPGKLFLRMNGNNYLGLALREEVVAADETATRACGAGPGAVRFISGTWGQHVALECRLASLHGAEAAILFSSAYAAVMGTLPALVTPTTAIISDELNHNCIINAIRLARPAAKHVYAHNDVSALEQRLRECVGTCDRALIVTDGVFSMRGDHAPLEEIMALAQAYDGRFADNVAVMVDDSHGIGALGPTGRGTQEQTGAAQPDILVATLGKALGVNGGYVAASKVIVDYLRETSPFYVYSNPITPGEAAAAHAAVDVLDSPVGRDLLAHLRAMTARFKAGLALLGWEILPGDHPVVPLMVRDTARTTRLVEHLLAHAVLATALKFPIVPRGDEEIRFQVCADHTPQDIDDVIGVIASFTG